MEAFHDAALGRISTIFTLPSKDDHHLDDNGILNLVPREGFEPPTIALGKRHSIRLSYRGIGSVRRADRLLDPDV